MGSLTFFPRIQPVEFPSAKLAFSDSETFMDRDRPTRSNASADHQSIAALLGHGRQSPTPRSSPFHLKLPDPRPSQKRGFDESQSGPQLPPLGGTSSRSEQYSLPLAIPKSRGLPGAPEIIEPHVRSSHLSQPAFSSPRTLPPRPAPGRLERTVSSNSTTSSSQMHPIQLPPLPSPSFPSSHQQQSYGPIQQSHLPSRGPPSFSPAMPSYTTAPLPTRTLGNAPQAAPLQHRQHSLSHHSTAAAPPSLPPAEHLVYGAESGAMMRQQQQQQQQQQHQQRLANSPREGARTKPQCWDHGCNGRQFSTFSNLLRHQRERSGTSQKSYCPRCGAEFTRSTARKNHLENGKCRPRRMSGMSNLD